MREEDTYHTYMLCLQKALPSARFFLNTRKFRDSRGVWQNVSLREGSGDLVGCVGGLWVEVEVKTARGRLSTKQLIHRRAIERAKGIYVVAKSPEETVDLIRKRIQERTNDHGTKPEPS